MSNKNDESPPDLIGSIWAFWRDALEPGSGFDPSNTATPDISRLSDHIKSATRGRLQGEAADSFSKMVDASAAYGQLAERVWSLIRGAREGGGDWKQVLREGLGGESGSGGEGADAWAGFARKWGLPEDAWRAFEAQVRQHPLNMGALLSGGEQAREAWQAAYGQGREDWTRRVEHWGRLQGEYAAALECYQGHLAGSSNRAMRELADRLIAREEEGTPLGSLREVYDLSVECGEEAYASLNDDPAFNAAQADLTNALMALRRYEQDLAAELLTTFGIPSREEMNSALKGLHDLRRELRHLKGELAQARSEISRLSGSGADRASSAGTAAVTPARSTAPKRRMSTAKATTSKRKSVPKKATTKKAAPTKATTKKATTKKAGNR
ncbi:MAG: poly(R)-hydroxyalkanoic acid synthase subunit PhaE [Gammaproteobacteria bacterium]